MTVTRQVSKVPVLGDIPLLGWLFRSHSTSKEKQNLMVFMRPSIMRDANAAAFHTNQKYNYLRAQQINAGENGFGLLNRKAHHLCRLDTLERATDDQPKQTPGRQPR